eukprot:TRINITY_DN9704_c0_g1_i4.p1 TRINITY_DN9704_c0_g1~~TRINITY_DN9704_c0_g1_i4.p1  ORF type:complete len:629 (-),score=92.08 TRINITY_DN9704_c0_g1_i4:240-2126(-)
MPLRWTAVSVSQGHQLSPRHVLSLVVHDKAMYAFGGYNGTHLDDLARFQFDRKEWISLHPIDVRPPPRHSHTAVVFQDSIYIYGGITTRSCILSDIYTYSIKRNQWIEKKANGEVPKPRWGHSAVVIGDRMYIFGGLSNNGEYLNDIFSYTFDTSTWNQVEVHQGQLPHPRHFHTCVAHGTCFYIFGGYGATGVSNDFWEFDVATSVWKMIPSTSNTPSHRRGHTAVKHGNSMYLFGGREQKMLKDVHKYDFVQRSWRELSPRGTFIARHFHASVVYGAVIYVFGGVSDKRNLGDFDSMDLAEEDERTTLIMSPMTPSLPRTKTIADSSSTFSLVSSQGRIRFKCLFEDEYRIISMSDDVTLPDLYKRFQEEYNTQLLVQYKDEEGDFVTIRTQDDLDEARAFMYRSGQTTLKVVLTKSPHSGQSSGGSVPSPKSLDSNKMLDRTSSSSSPVVAPLSITASALEATRPMWEIAPSEVKIIKKIGQGANGEVYHGVWKNTDVAVKKVFSQQVSDTLLREFRAEVHTMSQLRHPNVCLFMGAWASPPDMCIVMEYFARGSLYDVIHLYKSNLSLQRRLKMALDVSLGIGYLHGKKPPIIHRDLKSPNILVSTLPSSLFIRFLIIFLLFFL